MAIIDLVIPTGGARVWHHQLRRRLEADGHTVQLMLGPPEEAPFALAQILDAEAPFFNSGAPWLAALAPVEAATSLLTPDLTIALAPSPRLPEVTQLTLAPNEARSMIGDWAAGIALGQLPEVALYRDGKCLGRARPMLDNRVSVGKGLEDLLARVITLIVKFIPLALSGEACTAAPHTEYASKRRFLTSYLRATVPRLGTELLRRRRFHKAHWRVGYRLIDGPGVAERSDLSGIPWTVLPDDGSRFYADPFPFEWRGEHYIFVEDLDHAKGKAVISVSRIDRHGLSSRPMEVLEEPYHLSYPQVFARDGQIWMLPEASSGRELVLYRADDFPMRWTRHQVLIEDRAISDATLLEHGGRLWLLGTDASEGGSTSDTLVVYHATSLVGPWRPHQLNPILIDRASARPGGAVIKRKQTLLLPMQDGTDGYGGGLGLVQIHELTLDNVRMGRPHPIAADGFWPYPKVHTLNRAGRLEVVDGIAAVRK